MKGDAARVSASGPGDHFGLPIIQAVRDAVILTNPNNPTGAYVPPEPLLDWLGQISGPTQLLLEGAVIEFTAPPSLVRDIGKFPHPLVLRALTQVYAIPGPRVGYLAGEDAPPL